MATIPVHYHNTTADAHGRVNDRWWVQDDPAKDIAAIVLKLESDQTELNDQRLIYFLDGHGNVNELSDGLRDYAADGDALLKRNRADRQLHKVPDRTGDRRSRWKRLERLRAG